MSGESDIYPQHQVPTATDEQSFRTEVLRTLRDLSREMKQINERMHERDLVLQQHTSDLERQEADHRAEIARLREDLARKDAELQSLRTKAAEREKEHNNLRDVVMVMSTRFSIVWAALGILGASSLGGLVIGVAAILRGHP